MNPGDVTSSGLSLFTVQRMMEDRVRIWAEAKRRQRLAREAALARVARLAALRSERAGRSADTRLRNVLDTALTNPTVVRWRH